MPPQYIRLFRRFPIGAELIVNQIQASCGAHVCKTHADAILIHPIYLVPINGARIMAYIYAMHRITGRNRHIKRLPIVATRLITLRFRIKKALNFHSKNEQKRQKEKNQQPKKSLWSLDIMRFNLFCHTLFIKKIAPKLSTLRQILRSERDSNPRYSHPYT